VNLQSANREETHNGNMSVSQPKVSIGLPVYNGEDFIREAIESILGQTYSNLELIISDNASTDRTGKICEMYATRDERVRYIKHPENRGLTANFNYVFEQSGGKYFKWAAHDDVYHPDFIDRCVRVLEEDSSVILCYARTFEIDAHGTHTRELDSVPALGEYIPHRRFRAALGLTEIVQLWGLTRTDVLRKTPLLGFYVANDGPFLSGLSLYGRFYEIPETLFFHRQHDKRTGLMFSWLEPHQSIVAYDTRQAGKTIFPEWRLLIEHFAGINRVGIGWLERIRCYLEVIRWLKPRKRMLLRDMIAAGQSVPGIGPIFERVYKKHFDLKSVWDNALHRMEYDISSVIPVGHSLILVDDSTLGTDVLTRWHTIPFLERNGIYWGLPADDKTATDEVERLRQSGAGFMVFAWPSFWWFDHYTGFLRHLESEYSCIMKNKFIVVFDLRKR
jgi:glycosyltransferase involved in cell wall biosynthesis